MRVRCNYLGVSSPCTAQTWGECEDYYVTIAGAAPCSGTPSPGNALTSSATVVAGGTVNLSLSTPVNLSLSTPPTGTGLTYQWQSGPTNTGAWTNVGTSTSTYTPTVSATTWYRCIVTCSGVTGTSTPVQVTAVVANNIPLTGSSSVACGTSTLIYDNGGSAGNYGTSASGYIVLNNAVGSTSVITLSGTYSGIETCCDNFKIYSGSGIGGTLLYTYGAAGAGTIATFSSAAGETITIQFNSDFSVEGAGIALNAVYSGSCAVPACSGTPAPGATTATTTQVFAGGSATLGITTAQSGTGITYQWQSGSSASGPWTSIGGATSATYVASPTAATYYQCVVTCSASGAFANSTPILISFNAYCLPAYTYGTVDGDLISNVVIAATTLSNNTGTTAGLSSYNFYSGQPNYTANMVAANSYNVSVTAGSFTNQNFAAWIDYNDNNVFEASESIGFSSAATTTAFQTVNFTINLSCTPPLGQHRMRVRGVYAAAGSTIDPCATYGWGETEDYLITIVAGAAFTPAFVSTPTSPNCAGVQVTYTATAGQTNYAWTFPGTAGVDYTLVSGGTSASNTAVVVYNNSGSKTVSMNYASPLGCASAGAVTNTITITPATVAPTFTGGATTLCANGTDTYSATTTQGTVSYSIIGGTGASINATSGVLSSAGTTNFTVRATSTNGVCSSLTTDRAVTVTPATVAPTFTAGATTICANGTDTYTATTTQGTVSYSIIGGTGASINATSGVLSSAGTANFTVRATSTNGVCSSSTTDRAVTVTPATVAPTFSGGATTICANGTDTYSATTTQGTVSYSIIGGTGASINATTGVLSSAGTANFTVRATSTNGVCSSLTTDRAVTVNPAPTLLSLTGSAVCSGLGTITSSTSQSGGNYQLYNSANTAVGSVLAGTGSGLTWSSIAAGTGYYVIGTDATTSCNSAASSPVSITINSAPTVTANVTSTPVCLGTTVTLSGGGATTYSWDNGATNGAVFAPAATTTYTVIGTDGNGCTNTASVLVTVNTPAVTTSVVAGTAVWRGATSVDFGTATNWYAYDGTSYAVSASAPSSATSVIIPVNQGCVSQQPSTLANSGSVKNITIEAGATLTMENGTLVVVGNWENNGTFDAGTGTVQFSGIGNTTVGGSAANNFNNVEINKSGDAMLISPATIAGSLTLTNGNLNIEGYTLDMGSQVINGGSATSYVKTIGSGVLKRNVSSSPVVFPVGKSSYNPATLTNTGTADNFSVRVYDYVSTTGVEGGAQTTGQVVNRTWMVSEALTGGSDVMLKMQWNTGEELNGFVYSQGFMNVNHHNGSVWEELGVLNESNSPFYVEQSGISSFSPFTIGITGSALPIELISFQANCAGNKQVEVTWSTASEHNTSHFVVEKSRDGVNWTTLNTLGAAGNSTSIIEYALTDNNEVSGTTYYRLTQFDLDGASETFNIASANCGEQAATSNLVTYPNPSNGSFYLDFYTQDLTGPSSISVFDSRGVIIYRQDVLVEKGSNVFHIEKMDAAPGMYYIQVSNGTTTSYIVKHSLR